MKGKRSANKAASLLAWINCGRAGDAYYRAMSDWLATTKGRGSPRKVYDLAVVYEMSLNKYLACVEKLPVTLEREQDLANGRTHQSYLASDIKCLLPMIAAKRSEVRQIPDLAVMAQ